MDRAEQILIADDDADFVLLLRTAFEYAEFHGRFKVASDGKQAIQFLSSEGGQYPKTETSLALVDLALPRVSGTAVVRWIRQQSGLGELPVILMTGVETGTEAELATELGASDWVVKPFGFSKLVDLAEHLCASWLRTERSHGAKCH